MIYYFEYINKLDGDEKNFSSDEKAREYCKYNNKVEYCYKESDTSDGLPFIEIYKRRTKML